VASYHFDIGNSSTGPVGVCARVNADSPEQALTRLQDYLAALEEIELKRIAGAEPYIEYCNVYTGPENITVEDIVGE
jgi:hypothetical protein